MLKLSNNADTPIRSLLAAVNAFCRHAEADKNVYYAFPPKGRFSHSLRLVDVKDNNNEAAAG